MHSWWKNSWIHAFLKGISEIQTASFKIWAWRAESTSYDDNRYTASVPFLFNLHLNIYYLSYTKFVINSSLSTYTNILFKSLQNWNI